MDGRRLLAVLILAVALAGQHVVGYMVFEVDHKFKGGGRTLSAMKQHDTRRHSRMLSSFDLELGGNGLPSSTGLYFTKIGLGTPSNEYFVQVDTGSDILWVNCAGCSKCPTKSELGIKLTLYDPAESKTSGEVKCNDNFCMDTYENRYPGCSHGAPCQYTVAYGDGSSTSGHFVKDFIQLDEVTGDLKTAPVNMTVIFGCGDKQAGDLGSSTDAAVDGILGFGQANSSIFSQLAAAGKVKKEFAHCLDVTKGGGIFAIGDVVSPKVKTTPLIPNMPHYNVILEGIQVGGDVLQLPTSILDTGNQRGTIVDSGTTLAYLPPILYDSVMSKIMARQPGLKLHTVEDQFSCFEFSENVDDSFPPVTFGFKGSLSLTIYAHEYLFKIKEDVWCIGWQNGGLESHDGTQMILLGDMVLSNKLVVYDVAHLTIGWTAYNCSSSIKIKDEKSGVEYSVGGHNISSAFNLTVERLFIFLSVLLALLQSFSVS